MNGSKIVAAVLALPLAGLAACGTTVSQQPSAAPPPTSGPSSPAEPPAAQSQPLAFTCSADHGEVTITVTNSASQSYEVTGVQVDYQDGTILWKSRSRGNFTAFNVGPSLSRTYSWMPSNAGGLAATSCAILNWTGFAYGQ